ncbi:hypothetical protein BDV30DRAFT_201907 [Aspergillus minisclerotigenes]|uniref:Uncharacterized protein n=1 Tax=Aspergillus minisclerotigenes TaxID=656917 RepID=A0A5N6JPD4_9EURO|nr:hypothetical protein BDV30DRAFT_201907 [Aspergillus minisclerotigenes]
MDWEVLEQGLKTGRIGLRKAWRMLDSGRAKEFHCSGGISWRWCDVDEHLGFIYFATLYQIDDGWEESLRYCWLSLLILCILYVFFNIHNMSCCHFVSLYN